MSGAPLDASASEVDPLVGRSIGGKFVIERLLGAGAMGAVYRAHQTALERPVAIKVMHGGIASDPTYAARFQREARSVSRLDHPNLIRVLDYGQEPDGLLYIAMEFLDGRDLFSVIEDDWPLTHARIVDILSQTLSALTAAHDGGVLHRDLKPENIMLLQRKAEDGTPTDLVKVCDFGIAKVEEPEAKPAAPGSGGGRKLTAAGLVVGTPGYMAPEQARSEPCDARSDLYSVGVILYQLLSRRLPFEGNTPLDIVVKALFEAPPPLGSQGPTAAPGLEPICMKAMSKRPEDRFQSAREMRAALRAAQVLERQIVISSGDRPSMVNAPTQVEVMSSAASTGARAMPAAAAPPSRFWRAGGMLAGLAIAGVAFFALSTPHPGSGSVAAMPSSGPLVQAIPTAAVPSSSAIAPTAIPMLPVTSPSASSVSSVSAPSPSSSSRAPNRHPLREPKESIAIVPDAPQTSAAAPPVPAPAPETPSSVPAPAVPSPPPTPPPVIATPAPVPPAPPTFNVATARVDIGQARTNNAAATGGAVSRAINPFAARFTSCYRLALAQATSASEVQATLHLESDDQGYVTSARVNGAVPDAAARCVEALVTRSVRIEVDTGTANADVPLTFKPL